ncbi:hypothetical protein CQW23_31589 [Capsicum baccatum]|uniref:Uncharacterized protein n=1 Tax=Capsicum baccatum TaxID=33114 RepID=A0A2G2V788_CAPBA|nr:hypothetical protein CQW23_31589 [Capsicum baccatum]
MMFLKFLLEVLELEHLNSQLLEERMAVTFYHVLDVRRRHRAKAYEELRMQEMKEKRQRDEAFKKEVETLGSKIRELEQRDARMFSFTLPHIDEDKSAAPA